MTDPHVSLIVQHAHCGGSADLAVHTQPRFCVYLDDGARFWMGSVWTLRRGDVLVVPDGMPHHRVDTDTIHLLGLGVCGQCVPDDRWGPPLLGLVSQVRRGGCPVLRPTAGTTEALIHTLQSLQAELARNEAGRSLVIDGLMGIFTGLLLRCRPSERVLPVAETPLVARAMQWLSDHALEPVSLADVARAVGRDASHVAACVKRETGHPVGHWILCARMAVARDLLLHSDENVGVLAERVGYASPSHFHRTFRKVHGVTPDGWRRLHQVAPEDAPA